MLKCSSTDLFLHCCQKQFLMGESECPKRACYGCVSFCLITTGLVFTVFAIFQKDSEIGKVWLAGPTTMVVGLVLCGKVVIDWGPAMAHARDGSTESQFNQVRKPLVYEMNSDSLGYQTIRKVTNGDLIPGQHNASVSGWRGMPRNCSNNTSFSYDLCGKRSTEVDFQNSLLVEGGTRMYQSALNTGLRSVEKPVLDQQHLLHRVAVHQSKSHQVASRWSSRSASAERMMLLMNCPVEKNSDEICATHTPSTACNTSPNATFTEVNSRRHSSLSHNYSYGAITHHLCLPNAHNRFSSTPSGTGYQGETFVLNDRSYLI
ncbi:unnamed protein product [Anisakis simplex]|uniref:TMEM132D_N domain-containing protein n=1 Tax=Anisakis simplex TaxID=6269 RepID=A0A0M3JVX3_ANISI|nr:unnamed protein product [Anisakis simplex]